MTRVWLSIALWACALPARRQPRGAWLQRHVTFMNARPWVRHNEHYHVEFAVRCKPMG